MTSIEIPRLTVGARFRIVGIWASGLLGCAFAGAGLGALIFRGSHSDDGYFGGVIAGFALFTCARLWARERL